MACANVGAGAATDASAAAPTAPAAMAQRRTPGSALMHGQDADRDSFLLSRHVQLEGELPRPVGGERQLDGVADVDAARLLVPVQVEDALLLARDGEPNLLTPAR